MKTIYLPSGPIIIEDDLIARINEASQEILELTQKHSGGKYVQRYSVEIDIPDTRTEEQHIGHPSGQLIAQIAYDCGVQDNAFTQVHRALGGQTPTGKVSVDLGEYGHEGWDSLIDHENLLELPDVYFAGNFISDLIDTHRFWSELPDLAQVKKEHMPLLAEIVSARAKEYLETYVDLPSKVEMPDTARLFATAFDEHHYEGHAYSKEILYHTKLIAAANLYLTRKDDVRLEEFVAAIKSRLTD